MVDAARKRFREDSRILTLWSNGLKDWAILLQLKKEGFTIDGEVVTIHQIRARIRRELKSRGR